MRSKTQTMSLSSIIYSKKLRVLFLIVLLLSPLAVLRLHTLHSKDYWVSQSRSPVKPVKETANGHSPADYRDDNPSGHGPSINYSYEESPVKSSGYRNHSSVKPRSQSPTPSSTESKASSLSTDPPRGYILALRFNEQLESGLYDLYQLADLAHSWNWSVVEPFIKDSHFHFPATPSSDEHLRFSEVYDLQDLNENLRVDLESDYDLVVPPSEVWSKLVPPSPLPSYHVTVLHLLPYTLSRSSCLNKETASYINKLTSHLQCKDKCPVETSALCLNIKEKNHFRTLFQTQTILEEVLQQSSKSGSKMLMVIPYWNGIRMYKDRFFYWDPSFRLHHYKFVHAIRHSNRVQGAARSFNESLHLTPPTLGIHIRLERLMKTSGTAISECLDELKKLIQSLKDAHRTASAVLFRDYGKFGSTTCRNIQCSQFADELQLDQQMRTLGVTVQEFNPRHRNQRGISANVEQEVLSRTDILITVGYGSFQLGIVERFKRNKKEKGMWHDQDRIFRLCSS